MHKSTTREAAQELFGETTPAAVRKVQRLAQSGELRAEQDPRLGKTSPFFFSQSTLDAYKKRRQSPKD